MHKTRMVDCFCCRLEAGPQFTRLAADRAPTYLYSVGFSSSARVEAILFSRRVLGTRST
jgi:hypothetical protein